MARLNIEDDIFKSSGFQDLVEVMQGDVAKALGELCLFWFAAQRRWTRGELLPRKEFKKKWEVFLDLGLAEERAEGIYSCGAEDQFAWLTSRAKSARTAGIASGEARRRRAQERENLDATAPNESNHTFVRSFLTRCEPPPHDDSDAPPEHFNASAPNDLSLDVQRMVAENEPNATETNPLTLTRSFKNKKTKELSRPSGSKVEASPKFDSSGLKDTQSVKVIGGSVAKFVARYVEEFQRRYGTRPSLDKIAQAEARRIVEGVGLEKSLDVVTAYLQLNDAKYLAKCHDLTSLRCDANRVKVALDKGVERPNDALRQEQRLANKIKFREAEKDAEWERFAEEFKNRTEGE